MQLISAFLLVASLAVGQFRDIVEVAEKDPQLCETLKKVLKLTRGWEIARDHARTAVHSDNRMRVWCPQGSSQASPPQSGLLFKCNLGSVDLENPVGKEMHSEPKIDRNHWLIQPGLQPWDSPLGLMFKQASSGKAIPSF